MATVNNRVCRGHVDCLWPWSLPQPDRPRPRWVPCPAMHSRRPLVAHSSAYHSSIHIPPSSLASSTARDAPQTTLHKRAPPSSNLPPPAGFQQIYNTYSHPSSRSSSSSQPTPPTPNPRQFTRPPATRPLRKVMHNGDSRMIGPSCHDPDELVHLANDGTLPTDVNSSTRPHHALRLRQTRKHHHYHQRHII